MTGLDLVPVEYVERRIVELRGQRVLIDFDLAALYGVETRRLNEQVKRNSARFPGDFVFQLTGEEKEKVIAECDHLAKLRFSPHLPFAFTEHGALMAANVLNSNLAIGMSVLIVRAFVRLRGMLSTQIEILDRLGELENRVGQHDDTLKTLVVAIRQLMMPPDAARHPIGFTAPENSTHVL
ncbi:MAG: ORF6N domain-containing protein [Candidatus Bipolaricaulota bacterium]